jgi:hypothetical protein
MRGCTCRGPLLCALCASLAERAGVPATPVVPAMSEAVFMAAVIKLAQEHGWMVWHAYSAKKSTAGYPDLTLTHPGGGRPLLMIETKTDVGECTKAQEAWLAALAGSTGVVSACWRPSMWSEIVEQLRG